MKRHISIMACSIAAFGLFPAAAQASEQCGAMKSSIQVRQAEALEMQEKRDALAEKVEAAGEAWENAEAERLFGETQADLADEKKAEYDALKADFHRTQAALQSKIQMVNASVVRFNEACTPRTN